MNKKFLDTLYNSMALAKARHAQLNEKSSNCIDPEEYVGLDVEIEAQLKLIRLFRGIIDDYWKAHGPDVTQDVSELSVQVTDTERPTRSHHGTHGHATVGCDLPPMRTREAPIS